MHVEQNQNYFTPHLECTDLVYSSLHTPRAPAKCEEPIHHIAESVANWCTLLTVISYSLSQKHEIYTPSTILFRVSTTIPSGAPSYLVV
jgi:hypothetical protein